MSPRRCGRSAGDDTALPPLDAVNLPIAQARGLPNAVYTEPESLTLERERVFATTWACLGFASDLPQRSYALPITFLGLPLVIVRDRQATLRVFHNVCSHRGRRLVEAPGPVRATLRCPYHAWSYAPDGRLRGTPHIGGPGVHAVAGFDRARHGLKEVRSALWLGMIFVDLSGEAPSFADHIRELTQRWRAFWGARGTSLLREAEADETLRLEVNANWKLAVENYCESYHLPCVHPGLNSYSRLEDHYPIVAEDAFAGQGSRAYSPLRTHGPALPCFPDWPAERLRWAEYVALYPNVLLGLQADHVFAVVLEPLACDRTVERLRLFWVGDGAAAAWAPARNAVFESWRVVFAEDVAAVEGMQQGRYCAAFDGGVFSPVMETPTHHFHRWVAARLAH